MKRITILIVIAVLMMGSEVYSKDFSMSLTGQAGLDRGTWHSGVTKDANSSYLPALKDPCETGTHRDTSMSYGVSAQFIYKRDFKGFRPTLDFTYKHVTFDFSGVQATEHNAKQDAYSIRIGVTKRILGLDTYLLGGYSLFHNRPCLVEAMEGKNFDHDHDRGILKQNGPSAKIGAYKLFGKNIKIGPEVSVEFFTKQNTEFHSNWIIPCIGIRVQW